MTSRTLHAEVKRRIIGSLSEGRWKHGEGGRRESRGGARAARGTPVLRIERTAYTCRDVPLETRICYVNTARLAYLSQLCRH